MKAYYLFPVALLAIASCGSTKSLPALTPVQVETTQTVETKQLEAPPQKVDYSEYMVRMMEPRNVFVTTPLAADIKVLSTTRIKYTETAAFAEVDLKEDITKNIPSYKNIAYAKAAALYNADILISPSFVIETVDDHLQITVFGYPAVYSNFRKATKEDMEISEKSDTKVVEDFDPKDVAGEPKSVVIFDNDK